MKPVKIVVKDEMDIEVYQTTGTTTFGNFIDNPSTTPKIYPPGESPEFEYRGDEQQKDMDVHMTPNKQLEEVAKQETVEIQPDTLDELHAIMKDAYAKIKVSGDTDSIFLAALITAYRYGIQDSQRVVELEGEVERLKKLLSEVINDTNSLDDWGLIENAIKKALNK